LKIVVLSTEELAKALYEKAMVLIRPDQHVAWRKDSIESTIEAKTILDTVSGRIESAIPTDTEGKLSEKPREAFSGTVGMTAQAGDFVLDKMAPFQR